MSSIGVLFNAEAHDVEIGDPVEYMITLPTPADADLVRIRCLGKVVRLGGAHVAATLERYEFVRGPRDGDRRIARTGTAVKVREHR